MLLQESHDDNDASIQYSFPRYFKKVMLPRYLPFTWRIDTTNDEPLEHDILIYLRPNTIHDTILLDLIEHLKHLYQLNQKFVF